MDRERLDRWCEWGILGLVLAILVFSPLAFGAVRMQEFVVVQWLTVAVLLVWHARFWVNPKHQLLWPPVCWAVLAFMGYAVGRYVTADVEYVARQEVIRVLIYGFLFFAILNNLHRQETTQVIGLTLVFLATVMALYALYQFLSNSEYVWLVSKPGLYRKRGSGPFICPNHLAGYLEMLLPLAVAYTLTGRFSHWLKVLLGYAAMAIFVGIAVTVSRGGWTACAISLFVMFVWLVRQPGYRLQALLTAGALVTLGAVFFLTAPFSFQRTDTLNLAVASEDIRFMLWQPAAEMWQEHLWWGIGPGHFDIRFPQYRPELFDLQYRPERVHNDYLNTLVDWGLVGAQLVAVAWVLFYWDVIRSWKYVQRSQEGLETRRSNRTSVVLGGSLGLLAVLLHSFGDFNMQVPSNAILAVTLMAMVGGYFRFSTDRYWLTIRWPLRICVNLTLGAALVYLGMQSWQRTAEQYWLRRAEQARLDPTTRMEALERAFAAENRNFQTAYDIGEVLRLQSWEGRDGYQEQAKAAMKWFSRSLGLNPFDAASHIRYGMCLDWIGQHAEAGGYFQKALALDPHGYHTLAHVGWHYVQVEDYAMAEKWLDASYRVFPWNNPIATSYLKIVRERIAAQPGPK